nr:uncharacterized protein LOC117222079 [Megalopta genalis]
MDISSMLEVQVNEVKEVKSKENVTPKVLLPTATNLSSPISQEETNYYKIMFGSDTSIVRFRRLHCTACDVHIGSAPGDASNMFEHPTLHTLLCSKCRDFYGDGTFEQGDDATDMFCRWCANGGNLYCCSFCSNTFCYKCIKRNIDPVLRKKIEADEQWKCFVCDPTDLYPARATCWALLQYVQKMNRSLQNDRKLNQQEIDEKMSLDETNCCPRRRKRKRRRTGSNSEEEDETYLPKPVGIPPATRGRRRGRRRKFLNGNTTTSVTGQSYSGTEENSMDHDIPPSLLSCEQTMVEGENETVNTDGTIVPQPPQPPQNLLPRLEPKLVPQPLYNAIVNVVASNFLQPATPLVPVRHVHNPIGQVNLYQAVQCTQTPMVTIPNQSADMLNRLSFPLTQPQIAPTPPTSNVIEIESDSEDIAVVGPSRNSRSFRDHIDNNKAVPVALVSSKSSGYITVKKSELTSERRNPKTLNQRLYPHGQEIDSILTGLKNKLQELFETSKQQELKRYELNDARGTIKQFHKEIRDAVSQLASINDRIVREYNRWKRHQLKTGALSSAVSENASNNSLNKTSTEELPLDMVCVNESGTEDDNSDFENNIIIKPSEFIGITNVIGGTQSFKKKGPLAPSADNEHTSLIDKAVQVFDTELEDYDKRIRHSSLKKADQGCGLGSTREQFEKYEEQFIYYLQNRIDSETALYEESKDLPDPNETPLKDLIEANSPFISEMLETMDKSVNSNDASNEKSLGKQKDNDPKATVLQETNSVVDQSQKQEFKNVVNSMTTDLGRKKDMKNDSTPATTAHKETKSRGKRVSKSDDSFVINISAKDTSTNNCTAKKTTNNKEDECTILDD